MITFAGVSKSFGELRVLDDLSFTVARGQRVSLIGASGSGKTTILRILMTLERPDAGCVLVDGGELWNAQRDATWTRRRLQRHLGVMREPIGMVFQQFNLFPNMTAGENIANTLRFRRGVEKDEARIRALGLLERVGLREKADSYPGQLSGGQQQRVAIARALSLEPAVMLFDEVTSALDPELVGEVLQVLRELATDSDTTMLLVTHEMRFARDISDQVMMFDRGRVVESGSAEQIFTDPREERTKQFLTRVLDR